MAMNTGLLLRLTAPSAAVGLLLLVVGTGAAWHVHTMQREISLTLQVNVSSMRAAEELEIAVRELRTCLLHFQLSGDRDHLHTVHKLRPEIDRWLGEGIRWAVTPHEQKLMRRVRSGLAEFFAELDRESVTPRLLRLADDQLTREVLEPTHEYLDFNEKQLETSSEENREQAGRVALGLLLLGVCGSAGGLLAGLGLARAVGRSLVQLSVPVRDAAGQLEEVVGPFTLTASPGNALGDLEGTLRTISERIGEVVARLRQSEREVLRAEQLAAVGQMAAGMAHEVRN